MKTRLADTGPQRSEAVSMPPIKLPIGTQLSLGLKSLHRGHFSGIVSQNVGWT